MSDLVPLPPHPEDVPWPTREWPTAPLDPDVDAQRLQNACDTVFAQPWPETHGETCAIAVVHRGRLVLEHYGPEHGPDATLISWSMAKSMLHAVVGVLVREGRIDVAARADVPAWQGADDPRRDITLDQLLRMSSGLHFVEDYVDEVGSDCIRMLFGPGKEDVASYAESQALEHAPDTFWN